MARGFRLLAHEEHVNGSAASLDKRNNEYCVVTFDQCSVLAVFQARMVIRLATRSALNLPARC